jgi:quercetin dioxygenase-like cupin family protein
MMVKNEDLHAALGASATVLVGGTATGGKLALLEVRLGRGSTLPIHRHHWEDEIIYVLEGEVMFHVDGRRHPGTTGTCAFLPRGSEHSYAVESAEARLLVLVAPAGLERLYDEQHWFETQSSPHVEWLVTVGAKYGLEVTGPPPTPLRRNGHLSSDGHDGRAAASARPGDTHVN